MNNAAQSGICRHCGSSLTFSVENNSVHSLSESVFDHPLVKSFLVCGLFVILLICGLFYLSDRYYSASSAPQPYSTGAPNSSTGSESVKLPPNSWYHKSWWSYVSSYPSAKQILEKNKEVSGKEIDYESVKTLALTGKFSAASGTCFTTECFAEQEKSDKQQRIIRTGDKRIDYSDAYGLHFTPQGFLEIYAKKPDKMLRVIKILSPYTDYKTKDIYTGFNGQIGWERIGGTENSAREIGAQEIEKLKLDLQSAWEMNNLFIEANYEAAGIKNLHGFGAFVLTRTNDAKLPKSLYFDSVSGFLTKMDLEDMSVYFNDYRDFEGSKLPYMILYRRPEATGRFSWIKFEVKEWRINSPLEDSIFEK